MNSHFSVLSPFQIKTFSVLLLSASSSSSTPKPESPSLNINANGPSAPSSHLPSNLPAHSSTTLSNLAQDLPSVSQLNSLNRWPAYTWHHQSWQRGTLNLIAVVLRPFWPVIGQPEVSRECPLLGACCCYSTISYIMQMFLWIQNYVFLMSKPLPVIVIAIATTVHWSSLIPLCFHSTAMLAVIPPFQLWAPALSL